MKQLTFLFFIQAMTFSALGQTINEQPESSLPPNHFLLEKAQYIVNNYKIAVVLSANCRNRNYDLESILQMFTENAIIEVSINRPGEPVIVKKRTAKEYFSRLRSFCNGTGYDSVDIQFLPDIIKGNEIFKFENSCVIKRDIVQKFMGFKKGKIRPVYCDLTLKSISIIFHTQNGSYKALINRVTVEDTQACEINE